MTTVSVRSIVCILKFIIPRVNWGSVVMRSESASGRFSIGTILIGLGISSGHRGMISVLVTDTGIFEILALIMVIWSVFPLHH